MTSKNLHLFVIFVQHLHLRDWLQLIIMRLLPKYGWFSFFFASAGLGMHALLDAGMDLSQDLQS